MSTWEERFRPRPPAPDPYTHIETLWTLTGVTNKFISCEVYQCDVGLELRAGYSRDDVLRTELFRGPDARRRLDAKAAQWKAALIAKGFAER